MHMKFGFGRSALAGCVAIPIISALPLIAGAQTEEPKTRAPVERADALPVLGPKPFIDYFKPIPVKGKLSKEAWGAAEVGARDQGNGLEDPNMTQWNYWDGQILKGDDGKYRMFASRWDQSLGHKGWGQSKGVWAVSSSVFGPYRDMGLTWPDDQDGKGHNVTALRLPDGSYAVVVSETRNGDVFVSPNIDGPWRNLGGITVDQSAFTSVKTPGDISNQMPAQPWKASNVSIMARPDGGFEIIQRSGQILISRTGILGPYKVMGDSIYRGISGIPQRDMRAYEDPVIWFSGGWYHVIVNHWRERRAYHLISRNGIDTWRFQGLAYESGAKFIRYSNGVVNNWNKLERPGVVIEKGHVIAMSFAVVDTAKEAQVGNNGHGSKVVVVPFDGARMDHDLANVEK